jgi:protease-4
MKQFFGAFFGSLVGLLVATLLTILLVIVIVKTSINLIRKEKDEVVLVKPNSVIRLTLDGHIRERQKDNPLRELGGSLGAFDSEEGSGLNVLLRKIETAKTDNNVKGIYLSIKDLKAGFATLSELRAGLSDFKSSGKFIYAYAENYSQKEYYLASCATRVLLNPQGNLDWSGLSMNLVFFKQMFEKLDVDLQVFRHGKYKSAVEPFMLDKMSQANRFQTESFLNSIWSSVLASISADRHIPVEQLNLMADNLLIAFPEDAVGNLIDAVAYEDEVIAELKSRTGIKPSEKLKFVEMDKYHEKAKSDSKLSGSKIAVVYANGAISSGEGTDDEVGSDRIARAIRESRLDDKIKAIVLRVNSPGGSALASDVIWREMLLAKKQKPVVVSMGDLADSGGYYISCAAERIFAQPNTITGSIGVFGMIPNFQRMLEKKFGVTVDTVNTNRYSDLGSGLRPVTGKEYAFIQGGVEKVYDTFTRRVAEGRNMTQAEVDSIGQGRVWSGADALRINLVDEIGGLDKAIAYAAKQAKLKEYKLTELPRQKGPFDGILGIRESEVEARLVKKNLGEAYIYFRQFRDIISAKGIQARLPFEIIFEK